MGDPSLPEDNDISGTAERPWQPHISPIRLPGPAALDVIALGCTHCGLDTQAPMRVEILRIDAREAGWVAAGYVTGKGCCRSCGKIYAELHRLIPIECAEYRCPKCDRSESLDYRV